MELNQNPIHRELQQQQQQHGNGKTKQQTEDEQGVGRKQGLSEDEKFKLMLDLQSADEVADDFTSILQNTGVILALLLSMVYDTSIDPVEGNVWGSRETLGRDLFGLTLGLTSVLCMAGIFYSIFQLDQLSQIKKDQTKVYLEKLGRNIAYDMPSVFQEVTMNLWLIGLILRLSLLHRPWVFITIASLYLVLFLFATEIFIRYKQVTAKNITQRQTQ